MKTTRYPGRCASVCVIGCLLLHGSGVGAAPTVPELAVVGAGADGISLTRTVTDFRHTVVIESKNSALADDVSIEIGPLVYANGMSLDLTATIDGKPLVPGTALSVPGLDDLAIELSAALVESGEYMTSLVLRYAGKRETTILTVTRTREDLGVTLTDSGVSTETISLRQSADASFWITAKTGGQNVELQEPVLLKLTRNADNVSYASDHTAPVITRGGDTEVTWPAAISATTYDSFRFSIGGIDTPGQYQATLAFSATDRTPEEVTVGFSVRRSGIVAALIIAAGLLVSVALRWLKQDVQPRLRQQIDALNLLTRLHRSVDSQHDLQQEDKELIAALENRLKALFSRLQISTDPNGDATLEEIAKKLPMVPIAVNTHAELLTKDPKAQATLKHDLMDIHVVIKHEGTSDADITAAKKKLEDLRTSVRAAAIDPSRRQAAAIPMSEIDDLTAGVLAKLQRSKWVIDLGILGIAVVLGMYLLWAPTMTWGGTSDLFVAFLWGLGLHTVTAAKPFEGIGALAGRFGTP